MKPDARFQNQSLTFWANVRTISECLGYTDRKTGDIKVFRVEDIQAAFSKLGLTTQEIMDRDQNLTKFGAALLSYFRYRSNTINKQVKPKLMNKRGAGSEFSKLRRRLRPNCPVPMNKQRGKKKGPAYLTAIVNMLIEQNCGGVPCNYNPQKLTTFTRSRRPVRTLARRVDGAFPDIINPVAVWEIKEYYNTKTFGSRVADGVYESLLDGMELLELRVNERISVQHYLIVDDYFTWWIKGRSYLCRLIDMLNMGYVDEVLFGREVFTQLPRLVKAWVREVGRLKARTT